MCLLEKLETLGVTVLDSVPQFRSIRANAPLDQIEMIAADEDVIRVQPAQAATTNLP